MPRTKFSLIDTAVRSSLRSAPVQVRQPRALGSDWTWISLRVDAQSEDSAEYRLARPLARRLLAILRPLAVDRPRARESWVTAGLELTLDPQADRFLLSVGEPGVLATAGGPLLVLAHWQSQLERALGSRPATRQGCSRAG